VQALEFSTANVETLVGRSAEVVDMLNWRKLDVAGLQEVRNKNVEMKIVKRGDAAYKLYWSGDWWVNWSRWSWFDGSCDFVEKVIDVRHLNLTVIVMKLAVENKVITVLSVTYAPQPGLSIEELILEEFK